MLITLLLNVILNVHSSLPLSLSFSYKSLFFFFCLHTFAYIFKKYYNSSQKLKY